MKAKAMSEQPNVLTPNTTHFSDWHVKLRQILIDYFDETELATLCFDLRIEYGGLAGSSKASKTIEIIEFCARSGRVLELIDRCSRLRPNVDWAELRMAAANSPLVARALPNEEQTHQTDHETRREIGFQTGGTSNPNQLTWLQFHDAVRELARQLRQPPRLGGFVADILVGVSPGGVIVADLLARQLGGIPVISLWVNRTQPSESYFALPGNRLLECVVFALQDDRFTRILIVDDVSRTGNTMKCTLTFLERKLNAKVMKTAILVTNKTAQFPPNYSVIRVTTGEFKLPWTDVS